MSRTDANPTSWAMYQVVRYGSGVPEYSNPFLIQFNDDHLKIENGNVVVGNGIPGRVWLEANKKNIKPQVFDAYRLALQRLGVWDKV